MLKPSTCEYCFERPTDLEYFLKSRWLKLCAKCYDRLKRMHERRPVEKG